MSEVERAHGEGTHVQGAHGGDRYLALLRAVNVGGNNRIAMADLRALLEGLGYGEVRTHLQSGNAVFSVPGASDEAGQSSGERLAGRSKRRSPRRWGWR